MELQNVILGKADGVATIRLNRPKEFNAVNFDLFNDLIKAFEICHTDKDVKAVILTGEGKHFVRAVMWRCSRAPPTPRKH